MNDASEADRALALGNGWMAKFVFIREFRMCSDGWGLLLCGPEDQKITYFKDLVVCMKFSERNSEEALLNSIKLSVCGNFVRIGTLFSGDWVVDLKSLKLAPLKLAIPLVFESSPETHSCWSCDEQPCYQGASLYLNFGNFGRSLVTFPFHSESAIGEQIEIYRKLRMKQMAELNPEAEPVVPLTTAGKVGCCLFAILFIGVVYFICFRITSLLH